MFFKTHTQSSLNNNSGFLSQHMIPDPEEGAFSALLVSSTCSFASWVAWVVRILWRPCKGQGTEHRVILFLEDDRTVSSFCSYLCLCKLNVQDHVKCDCDNLIKQLFKWERSLCKRKRCSRYHVLSSSLWTPGNGNPGDTNVHFVFGLPEVWLIQLASLCTQNVFLKNSIVTSEIETKK